MYRDEGHETWHSSEVSRGRETCGTAHEFGVDECSGQLEEAVSGKSFGFRERWRREEGRIW